MTKKHPKLTFTRDSELIPIPAIQSGRSSMFDQLPLLDMLVNQSLTIDCTGQSVTGKRVYFTTWLRKACLANEELAKRHFVTRVTGTGCFRVWRTF
jgi:hypothetical protein